MVRQYMQGSSSVLHVQCYATTAVEICNTRATRAVSRLYTSLYVPEFRLSQYLAVF